VSDSGRFDKNADEIARRYEEESLMLKKRSEEFKVIEEVFDRLTLEGIYKLMHRRIIDTIHGVVKAGKEARIYWGQNPEAEELAIKIYYTSTAEFRKGMLKYIEGDPRFRRVRRDPRGIIYTWTQKEFKNLKLAEEAGVDCPKPMAFYRNILVMSFIGSDGVPAPLLREVAPTDPETFYRQLLHQMRRLYTRVQLVHGDLSEYNIMVWGDSPVIFDISQAVLIAHPMSDMLIQRDIKNVNFYFRRLGVEVIDNDTVEDWVKGGAENLS
jgi:RIO kinase 1